MSKSTELIYPKYKKGFYYWTPQGKYFFVTNKERRTKALCKEILEQLGYNMNNIATDIQVQLIKQLQRTLLLGYYRLVKSPRGDYHDLHGDDWGFGCDSKDNFKVILLKE